MLFESSSGAYMTRVNVVPVEFLLDEWLIAEYRELKRIPSKVVKGLYVPSKLPSSYRMGSGHEKFFIDKLRFLKRRHDSIRREMKIRYGREYDITVEVEGLPADLLNDWSPSRDDIAVNVGRLRERYHARKSPYHYYGKVVDDNIFEVLYG